MSVAVVKFTESVVWFTLCKIPIQLQESAVLYRYALSRPREVWEMTNGGVCFMHKPFIAIIGAFSPKVDKRSCMPFGRASLV